MNKEDFIKALEKATGFDHTKCILLNDILENNFIIGKKNKEKIISDITKQLELTDKEANETYDIVMSVLGSNIKDKLEHPFGPQD